MPGAAHVMLSHCRNGADTSDGTASLKATCCGNHHSTEINLYTFSQDSENRPLYVPTLPPALVAEAPEPADISLGGEKTVGRCAPFVEPGPCPLRGTPRPSRIGLKPFWGGCCVHPSGISFNQ